MIDPMSAERISIIGTFKNLIALVTCVPLMLGCSLSIGVSTVWPVFEWAAIALFVAGLLSMAVAMFLALLELRICLQQVEYEHQRIVSLDPDQPTTRS